MRHFAPPFALAALLSGGAVAQPTTTAPSGLKPGLWEIVTQGASSDTTTTRSITSRICYSPEDVASPTKVLPPQRGLGVQCLLSCDKPALVHAIKRSCEIKVTIVAADERETGVRAVLNFGHTFAHAIEAGLGYGTWLHGEAVGCGMVMAADLSVRLGLIDRSHADRVTSIVARAGLPVRAPALGTARFLQLMRVDKKADGGEMRFVLLDGPARAVLRPVDPEWVSQTIQAVSQAA